MVSLDRDMIYYIIAVGPKYKKSIIFTQNPTVCLENFKDTKGKLGFTIAKPRYFL